MKEIKKRLTNVEERVKKIETKLEKGILSKESMYVECNKCGYNWITRSRMDMVSCGNCGNKVRR